MVAGLIAVPDRTVHHNPVNSVESSLYYQIIQAAVINIDGGFHLGMC